MSDKLEFIAEVREGKLHLTDQQTRALDGFLSGRRKPVRFVLSKKTDVRSNQANALYWAAYVTPVARHCGYAPEEAHDLLKDMFLGKKFVRIGKLEKEIRKTTTDLSPREFSEYLLQIAAFAGQELGLMLPADMASTGMRAVG